MVAIVGGAELGLGLASGLVLGARGQVGSSLQGRSNEGVTVNAVTGNLVLQRQDEYVAGQGLDIGIVRTYNSLGLANDDNGDNWRLGYSRKIAGPSVGGSGVNTAGNTIKRIGEDGAEVIYAYDTTRSAYVSTKGAGAYDLLTYSSTTKQWTWTDGDTQRKEIYDNVNGGRLIQVVDVDGNTLTLAYNGAGLVTLITDANGEKTAIDYETGTGKTNNIAQIRTLNSAGTLVLTRVRYGYDSNNRLITATVDLSPADSLITDGKTYVTTYTYDDTSGISRRLASISQTDGSQLLFSYVQVGADYRIQTVKDVRGADIRTTTYAYDTTARKTTVTDPVGQITEFTYDTSNQLLSIKTPAVNSVSALTSFTYDASGNVTTVTDGRGNTVTYGYDTNGNRILERDAAGNTVTRTFGTNNQLLTETAYTVPDPDGAGAGLATGSLTTRYVYDTEFHLRFTLSPEGRVTEYRYNAVGQQTNVISYLTNLYTVSGLTDTQSQTEAQLTTWLGGVTLAQTARIDTTYDVRGQVDKVTTFASVDAAGAGVADGTQSTSQYIYDQAGQLLQKIDARGVATTGVSTDFITSFTYDGLGRQLTTTDALGRLTTAFYEDGLRKTTLTLANSQITATTYDQAGNPVSIVRSGVEGVLGTTTYTYNKLNQLVAQTDPTGVKSYFIYDAAGRQVGQIDGVGAFIEYSYNRNDQLSKTIRYTNAVTAATLTAAATDPTTLTLAGARPALAASYDRTTYNVYDATGRLAKTIDGLGAVVQYLYDGANRLTDTIQFSTVLTPANLSALAALTTEITPTDANTTVAAVAASDRRNRQFYSNDGLLLGTLDGEGYLIEHLYNAAGQRTQTIKYATQTASANWAAGTLATLRPAVNATKDQSTYYLYNGKGQLVGTVDAESYLNELQYDLVGNQTADIRYATKVTYTPGNTLAATRPTVNTEDQKALYQYDALNQLTRIDSLPDGLVTTYAYDNVGNRTQTVKAVGATEARTETLRYDSLGRVTQQLTAEGAVALAAYGASPTQPQIDMVWTQYGVKHTYDTAGRRISSADQLGNKTLFYYDAAGRLRYTINALGEVTEAAYSVRGDLTASRRYATRLSTATLGTLSGGLVSGTLAAVITNALDSAETFGYDKRGMVITRTDALGNDTILSYNAFGELKIRNTKVDSANTRYFESFQAYDRRGLGTNPRKDTTSTGGSTTTMEALILAYDAFGRVTRTVDARGKNWDTSYDRLGRTLTTTTPGTAAQVMTYDAFGRVLTRKDALLNTTTYTYDTANRKVTITSPEGIATSSIKNRRGETVSVTDGRGNITSYNYDANGQLKNIITPAGTTTQNYDRAGQQIETVDANGIKTAYTYDAAGRVLTRSVDPTGLNLTSKTFYDAKSQAIWQQDASGIWTQTQYDLKGQITAVIIDPTTIPNTGSTETAITLVANAAGLNLRTDYTYDARGKTLTVTEGAGTAQAHTTQYDYDKLGRRIAEHNDPWGTLNLVTTYSYDLNDNLVSKTDPLGYVTRYVYSDKNQLIYSVDPTGAVVKTDYDGEGRVIATTAYANAISLTSPSVLAAAIAVADITGRLTLNAAADQITRTVYNKDGQIQYRVDPTNAVTALTYDYAGNVTQTTRHFTAITVPGTVNATTIAAAIVPHANDQAERTVYDAANRATFSIDASNYVTQTVYDNLGQATKQIRYTNALAGTFSTNVAPQIVSTAPGSGSYVLTNTTSDRTTRAVYDAAGRTRFNVDGEGYITERRYDALGRETKRIQYAAQYTVADGATTASVTAQVPATITTEPVETSLYDTAGRLSKTIDGEGNTTLHVYDAAGRETDTTVAYGTADASTTHRVFDLAGRLTQETVGYGSADAATTRYTLDAVGNRTKIIDPRGIELAETDSAWAVAMRQSLSYPQLLVNLTAAQKTALLALYTTTQTFDANGHVTQVTDPFSKTIQTQYDAFGNAVKVTDQRGNSGFFYFDKNNRNTWQVDPENYATQTFYNAFGTVDKVTHYAAKITGTPAVGTVPTVTANATLDQTTLIEHDKRDLQTKITDAESGYETMAYDAFGNKISYRNKLAGVYTYTFDRKGQVKSETTPSVTVTTVDTAGVVTPTTQALVTQYSYDARGNQTLIREAAGTAQQRDTVIGYDKVNRETRRDLPAISVFNAATKTSSTQTPYTTIKYDGRGNVVEVRDAAGNRALQYYDVLNRKVAGLDGTGALSEYTYDDAGNLIKERTYSTRLAIASQVWTTRPVAVAGDTYREMNYVYDANRRLVQTKTPSVTLFNPQLVVANPNNSGYVSQPVITQLFYDATGNVVKTIDGRGYITLHFYDKLGQRTLSVDPLGYVTRAEYDGSGNVLRQSRYETKLSNATIAALTENSSPTAIINEVASVGQNRVTETDYDRLGRKKTERQLSVRYTSVNDSGVATTTEGTIQSSYLYDAAGNLTQQINAEGSQTNYSYDVLGRQIQQLDPSQTVYSSVSGSTVTTTTGRAKTEWQYDALGNRTLQTRFGATTADNQVTKSRYDAGGNVLAEWDALNNRTDYAVDAAGKILRQHKTAIDVDGITHTHRTYFSYDAAGREVSRQIVTDEGAGNAVVGEITSSTYNAFGDVATHAVSGITQTEYRYDSLGKLFWTNAETGTPRVYVYDASGNAVLEMSQAAGSNLVALTDPSQVAGLSPQAVQIKFSVYDARNQLTDVYQAPMEFTGLTGGLTAAQQQVLQNNTANTPGVMQQVSSGGSTGSDTTLTKTTMGTADVWGLLPEGDQSPVTTNLNPTTVTQAGQGQTPISLAPWSTSTPYSDSPTQSRVVKVERTAVLDGNSVRETITTTTDTTISGFTTSSVKTETVNHTSYQLATSTNVLRGGIVTANSQLAYIPPQAIKVTSQFSPSYGDYVAASSSTGIEIPFIQGFGTGSWDVELWSTSSHDGTVSLTTYSDLTAPKIIGIGDYGSVVHFTRIVIRKAGFVLLDAAVPIESQTRYLQTASAVAVAGVDPSVKAVTMSVNNGVAQTLTYADTAGGGQWIATNVGVASDGWQYNLYSSASTLTDTTLIGAVKGAALNNPNTRNYLYRVGTEYEYYRKANRSDTGDMLTKQTIGAWVDGWVAPTQSGSTVLNPTSVNQAIHGQDPLSLAPWTTTTPYTDSPTQTRVVTVNRTAWLDGNTVRETIVTTMDTIITTVVGATTTRPDVIDYGSGSATVGDQTTVSNTTTTTTRAIETKYNNYTAQQIASTTSVIKGGAITTASQLVFTAPVPVIFTMYAGTGPGYSDLLIDIPPIAGSGSWEVELRGIGWDNSPWTKTYNLTTQFYYFAGFNFEPLPNSIIIRKNGFVVLDQTIPQLLDGQSSTVYTNGVITVTGVDSSVQGIDIFVGGAYQALTYTNLPGGPQWIATGNINPGSNWEYHLYNNAGVKNDSTRIGAVRGYSLSDPGSRTFMFSSHTDYAYTKRIVSSDSVANSYKADIAVSTQQSKYLLNLIYSVTTGSALSNQIHRQQSHDAFGGVSSETDGRGNITQYTYNELGQLIRKQDPQVAYTGEDGVKVSNFTPITNYYVNAIGQTVGSVDANGYVTTQVYRNGVLQAQRNPDAGIERYYYDLFGNVVAVSNAIGQVSRYQYDKLNRQTRTDFAGGNYDAYEYDTFGNRIAHTNGVGNRETYLFDGEGRIRRYQSFEGRLTSYTYTFNAGIGERGGYTKTTTDSMQNSQTESIDLFGKTRSRTDLGGHVYNYTYNAAGWLTKQTNSAGQNIDYTYYNNGYLKEVRDLGINSYALFQYDKDGNRILESYSQTPVSGGVQGLVPYQMAKATYDALNRVTTIEENGKFALQYEYDKVSNRRRVQSTYYDLLTNTQQVQDFWYKYDEMNRFTTTMGQLVNGQIVRGSTGYDISYNGINQRRTQISTDAAGLSIKEMYEYDNNGYLTNTWINPNYNVSTNAGNGVVRAQRVNNAIGDRTHYYEYNASHIITSEHAYTYDRDHNLTDDRDVINNRGSTTKLLADGRVDYNVSYNNAQTNAATITYQYGYEAWDSYQQKTIVVSGTAAGISGWRAGTSTFDYDVNGHVKSLYDHQEDRTILYTNNQNGQTLKRFEYSGTSTTGKASVIRDFYYLQGQTVGDQGTDKVASRTDYAQTLRGSALEGENNKEHIRNENATRLWQQWANNGYIDWDLGTSADQGNDNDYQHQDIGTRVIPVTSADFDQNFQPINENYPLATAGTYVTRTGDTLRTIAAAVWGDAALWYLIADANGLKGTETLTADRRLTLPNVVTNIHNNASTHRPTEAGLSLGDTSPTLPEPPPPPHKSGGGGCGGIGMILIIIVAVVVTIYTAGAATGLVGAAAAGGTATAGATMTAGMAALAGANIGAAVIGGVVGSIVSQGLAMAMGMQDGFSWGQVAMAGIGAGIGAGVGRLASSGGTFSSLSGNGFGATVGRGVIGNVASQGLSVASGLQTKFSWTQVAASAAGSAAGWGAGELMGKAQFGGLWDASKNPTALGGVALDIIRADVGSSLLRGTISGLASGGGQSLIAGGRPNWGLIAANSFGQAAGDAITSSVVQRDASAQFDREEMSAANQPEWKGFDPVDVDLQMATIESDVPTLSVAQDLPDGSVTFNKVTVQSGSEREWDPMRDMPNYFGGGGKANGGPSSKHKAPLSTDSPISVGYSSEKGFNVKAEFKNEAPFELKKWSEHTNTSVVATQEGGFVVGTNGISGEGKLETKIKWLEYSSQDNADANKVSASLYTKGGGTLKVSNESAGASLQATLLGVNYAVSNSNGILISEYSNLSIPISNASISADGGGGVSFDTGSKNTPKIFYAGGVAASVESVNFDTSLGLTGQFKYDANLNVKVGVGTGVSKVDADWSLSSTLKVDLGRAAKYLRGLYSDD